MAEPEANENYHLKNPKHSLANRKLNHLYKFRIFGAVFSDLRQD
jgi:hypothetical protein